jgi:His Kinase A (phospho-acceptor) domain
MVRTEAQGMDMGKAPHEPKPSGDEARGGHLGFVAHEIRNPLSTALWTAELLARMDPAERGGARGEKLSAICLRSVARVRQLVEDHLLSERLDIGGLPLRLEGLGVAEVLATVVERRPAGSAPVAAEVDRDLAVEADRALLERALEGLVAVAGAEGAPVTVAAQADGGDVTVVVGGRPADPAALADPVKGAPSDPAGRALALPLVRRIALALGGALVAGEGGWKLTLPRARAYTPRPSPAARP